MSTSINKANDNEDPMWPHAGLVRRLARRYLFVFAAVVGLVGVDQAVVQPSLAKMGKYAPVINVAGRQRMLSQKLAKAALSLQAAEDEKLRHARQCELRDTLTAWIKADSELRNGEETRDVFRIDTPAIRREWLALDSHFETMCTAANEVARLSDHMKGIQLPAATNSIVDHEAQYLQSMDRIVSLMEGEATASVRRLRICAAAIAVTIVLLLVGLGWFVMRPAMRNICGQVDVLESAVAARTHELSAALAALRREITVREAADQRSKQLYAQLAHASRVSSLGQLAGGLAHELNHPLATITNYAEACEVELSNVPNGSRTDRITKYCRQTKQAALRAGDIVRRMRDFVRPEARSVNPTPIDGVIREVIELCQPELTCAGIELSVDLQHRSAVVECDSIQIQQVLVNLIQNALQAMLDCPAGKGSLQVTAEVLANSVHVCVLDNGPGFLSTDLDAVFAPFHTTKRDGLGIGLAICRSIVEQHGGSIWAESPHDCGARVVFSLPLVNIHAASPPVLAECVCR